MKIRNQRLYDIWIRSKTEKYEVVAISWAIRFAETAERGIRSGISVSDAVSVIDEFPRDDPRGVTPLMCKMAVKFLLQCWEYGPELGRHLGGRSGVYNHQDRKSNEGTGRDAQRNGPPQETLQ